VAETPARAKLIELDADFQKKADGKTANVQFNPESLKVTYANPGWRRQAGGRRRRAGGQERRSGGRRRAPVPRDEHDEAVDDALVRRHGPARRRRGGCDEADRAGPLLHHAAGARRPLRAQLSLTMSRQEIKLDYTKEGAGFTAGSPGQNPLSTAVSGATLQGLAAGAGGTGAGWQAIAAGNGIEDPLRLAPAPGQLVDLGARGAR
jgi:hypothetical protein